MGGWTMWGAALVLALAPVGAAAHAAGGSAGDREVLAIADAALALNLDANPEYASQLGKPGYEGRVGDPSFAGMDRQAAKADALLARLKAVAPASLSDARRVDHAILTRQLGAIVEGNRFPQRAINFTNREAWPSDFASLGANSPFRTDADVTSYVDRLARYDEYHRAAKAVADEAIARRTTLPCSILGNFERSITGLQADPADRAAIRRTRFFEPFTRARPTGVSAEVWAKEAVRLERVIAEEIQPALADHLAWFRTSYRPACQTVDGVSVQPMGREYYAFRVRQMTTTDRTPDEIHEIGLKEVARIRAEMVEVARRAGYPTREAYIAHLRTDPRYYAKTPEELMSYTARVTKEIDGKMPALFGRLPRLPYGLKEIPAETAVGNTTAYYNAGAPAIGKAGFYFVNTTALDQRPLFEVPALSVHEAVPGHHHQIALAQELDLPEYRKGGYGFTAFSEGWGLYSERLGIEMGLYDTPAKDMGRLSYEMWRATRLVVDTGIHAMGWDKAKAVAFMLDNTALSAANIDAEVNRYIGWPGQALAYKIGELKIRELRSLAESELGPRFRLADFHDVVLGQGSIPLDVLDGTVRRWIAATKAKAGTEG